MVDELHAHTAATALHVGDITEEAIVQRLDFVAVIEAHRKWKERLVDYDQFISTEKIDRVVTANAPWIHGFTVWVAYLLVICLFFISSRPSIHNSTSVPPRLSKKCNMDAKMAVDMLLEGEIPKSS